MTKPIANEENKGIEIKEEKRGNYQPSIKREIEMRDEFLAGAIGCSFVIGMLFGILLVNL